MSNSTYSIYSFSTIYNNNELIDAISDLANFSRSLQTSLDLVDNQTGEVLATFENGVDTFFSSTLDEILSSI